MKKKAKKTVTEITLTSRLQLRGIEEILKDLLVNCGFRRDELIEFRQERTVSVTGYVFSPAKARSVETAIRKERLRHVKIKRVLLRNQDWQNAWKDDFHTFALTKHLDVVPLWEKREYVQKRKIPVYIDTVLAFGTGLHETTQFMAGFIESKRGTFESFLDVGTGTGILAVIACKHGACRVHAVDIAKMSIDAAKKNIKANRCRVDRLKATDIAKYRPGIKFDFVAANLITDELIRVRHKLISLVKENGWLAISGVSRKYYSRVREAFSVSSLRCVKVAKGKVWTAILFKKVKR